MTRSRQLVAVLVLGTADWDQAIATNQHYATRALAEGYTVTFVESMGLRRLELSRRDVVRILRRLVSKLIRRPSAGALARPRPEGLQVLTPFVVPQHTAAVARWFNERSLRRLVAPWLEHDGPKLLWTYSPETYRLEEFADGIVYHCVDLLHEVPGITPAVVLAGEQRLATAGAVAAGTGSVVVDHLRAQGFASPISWPNVADVGTFDWTRPGAPTGPRAGRVVFGGNLSTTKVDFPLLRRLVEAGLDLHLAGPVSEGGGNAREELDAVVAAGATYHGMLRAKELADLCATASVGVIPYLDNAYTRGVSPLKTYEYLAAGACVVSTAIPAVVALGDDVLVCGDRDDFVAAVVANSEAPSDAVKMRRLLAAQQHSWTRRGEEIRRTATAALVETVVETVEVDR
ncbi:glycosyltransferase [Cellulomonas sp. ICMP 17802]|uniref:glycosyltransferase n=1 Tax=Cellulomonas sp. ICMP 17802 TaxID=3239199 RepID=UPI00351B3D8B